MWNRHVFWRVVDPLLLWQTGWRCGRQGAVAVYTAVREPRLTSRFCDFRTTVLWCTSGGRSGQSWAGEAVGKGYWIGGSGVSVGGGGSTERSSCGVSGGLGVGEGNDLRGARQGGIGDERGGISSMWGDYTCWTTTPITGLCPPHLLRLRPRQGGGPWGISHVHHCIVNLKLANLPRRRSLLLRPAGGAAINGVSTEGHPGSLSGQTVKTGEISIKLRQHQDPRAVATRDGYTSR